MRRAHWTIPLSLAGAQVLLHLLTAGRYGIFRDEFYYWDCANHLAWGYVDHPPLSIAVLAAWKALFGDSVLSLRIPPALAGGALILAVARLAARMGGGVFAQSLAALVTFAVPSILGGTGYYSMNAFELLFWALGYLVLLDVLESGRRRAWVALGVCVGLGLLNKISVGVFAFASVLVLVARTRGHILRTPGPYLAGAIAVLLFVPHVIWQIIHDWPTREFIANAQRYKIVAASPLAFVGQVALEMGPTLAPLHVAGLAALLWYRPLRPCRALAWVFLITIAVFLANRSKPYYTVAAFPPLIAAAATWIEAMSRRARLRALAPAAAGYAALSFAFTAPFAIPLLPVETFIAYQNVTGIHPSVGENRATGTLPQFFADRFGWKELAQQVAGVFGSLPREERADCLIVAKNYGEAGAINYYGRGLGLPRAVSQHNSYYLWGYGDVEPKVYVIIGQKREDLDATFEQVTEVARTGARYAMPDETNVPIWICRGIRVPLDEAWRRGRMYI